MRLVRVCKAFSSDAALGMLVLTDPQLEAEDCQNVLSIILRSACTKQLLFNLTRDCFKVFIDARQR